MCMSRCGCSNNNNGCGCSNNMATLNATMFNVETYIFKEYTRICTNARSDLWPTIFGKTI